KQIAALLLGGQLQRFGNIRKNPSQARNQARQFGRVVAELTAEIIQAGCLSQIAFNDLDEGKVRKRFVSFVTAPQRALKTLRRGVIASLQCKAGLAGTGSALEHHERALAALRTIQSGPNRASFGYPPDVSCPLRD